MEEELRLKESFRLNLKLKALDTKLAQSFYLRQNTITFLLAISTAIFNTVAVVQ